MVEKKKKLDELKVKEEAARKKEEEAKKAEQAKKAEEAKKCFILLLMEYKLSLPEIERVHA